MNTNICLLSQPPTTRPYLTSTDAFHIHPIHLRLVLILSYHLRLG
jgi:hypothetical protein